MAELLEELALICYGIQIKRMQSTVHVNQHSYCQSVRDSRERESGGGMPFMGHE